MRHVFIIGSKGIPGAYGGYETFVDKLTEYHQNHRELKYHVACKAEKSGEFEYHNARCFQIKALELGAAQAIFYDIASLQACCRYIRKNHIENSVVYILAYRIGPFMKHFQRKIHKLGGVIYTNPDGHEYLRRKWSWLVRKYWRFSERLTVKHSDLLICDSQNIEKYMRETYASYHPETTFIAYGSETDSSSSPETDAKYRKWMKDKNLKSDGYYLVVGRFVPENNFEIMLREFMNSKSGKDLVIITTINDRFMEKLENQLHFQADRRIKFVGTVYHQGLLRKIRENAYGYLHGHEVGGTNPSLLEALGSTNLNLLLKVSFNKEVGQDAALYWTKETGNLAALIDKADRISKEKRAELGGQAKKRIREAYSWEQIANKYEKIFLEH
ncbi:MAG: glycosyltransferase family 1 protein [Lachnospiraceae bacterium]|nr:glycosyltransferase family 1 protein [Lachnospiraceae bacterium]